MKNNILKFAFITFIALTSCKKEDSDKNTPKDEQEMVDTVSSSIYDVSPATSSIEWTGSKPTGKHTGTIQLKNGIFEVTDGKVTGGTFTIDMNTINVTDLEGNEKTNLETHLKGTGDQKEEDHFFNVNKFPLSNFKIKSISEANGAYFIKGDLTLKEITKEVSFTAEISVSENEINFISDPFKINRTEWGVNYASKSIFDNLKDKFIDDDIELLVKLKGNK